MKFTLQYKQYSEKAILIEWPSEINQNILGDLLLYKIQIEDNFVKDIVEVISGYNSLLIYYDGSIDNFYSKVDILKSLYSSDVKMQEIKRKRWEIPVCYSSVLATDLNAFSTYKSLTVDQVIKLHTAPEYTIYCIGFLPGFLYLGGLDEKLFLPRKKTPSLKVKKGSVAIGGNQTGIYPTDSPGGWYVIGQCPLDFFDVHIQPPCVFEPGDLVSFVSIDVDEYNDIRSEISKGRYMLKSTFV